MLCGKGTLCAVCAGFIGNRIANAAGTVVILTDAFVDAEQNPAQGGQSRQQGASVGGSRRRIQCGIDDQLRKGQLQLLLSPVPDKFRLQGRPAGTHLQSGKTSVGKSGNLHSLPVDQQLSHSAAVGEQIVQKAVRECRQG